MKCMKAFLVYTALFLVPAFASAAGFSDQSIFLSKDSVTEGDTVLVHVVISNASTSPFAGSLKITDEASSLGTIPINLASGAADTFSVSWKPLAGTHNIIAVLTLQNGSVVATQQASFSIASKPAPPQVVSDIPTAFPTVEPSTPVENAITDVAPSVASSTKPIFKIIDDNRTLAAQKLYDGVTWARQELAKEEAAKPATSTPGIGGLTNSAMHMLWVILVTGTLYVCTILRSVFTSVALFYPVVAFLFLYLMWKGYKTVRRPSY